MGGEDITIADDTIVMYIYGTTSTPAHISLPSLQTQYGGKRIVVICMASMDITIDYAGFNFVGLPAITAVTSGDVFEFMALRANGSSPLWARIK